jgi:Putative auto-transporter adhesin, head GIN domain
MKNRTVYFSLTFLIILSISCNILSNAGARVIKPSNVIISENRDVSGFNAINFSTIGKINLMQGDRESLNISGPDNLVPEITTTVSNGTLFIKTKEMVTINPFGKDNTLVFTIVVKDLTSFNISGAGDVQVETLSTPSLDINMSGAGKVVQNQLTTDKLNITISGAGGIDISGQATQATIDLSGAGSVNAPDLQIQTASITISGLGGATLWVTDQLTGTISGVGSISYYGNPQTNTTATGVGQFKSLGNK